MANGAPTVSNGLVISGVTTTSSINIGTGSSIFSPAANTLSFGTNSNERLRITSDGKLLLGTDDTGFSGSYTTMTIGNASTQNTGLTIASSPSNGYSRLHFADANSGAAVYAGWIAYSHADDALLMSTNNSGSEKLRIDSSGRVIIGDDSNRPVWGINPHLQVSGTEWDDTCIALQNFGNNTRRPSLLFTKGRSGTIGNFGTAVNAGEGLGIIGWSAHDTTDAENLACYIQGLSESAPTANNQYGRISFYTVNGGTTAYERLRINKEGHLTTPGHAIFSARGQGSWNTFNSGSGWYNLGTSSYSGSNYYINHGWTTSGGGCGVRGVTSAGNSIWDNAAARFTAPVDGFYFFEINMYIRTTGGGRTFHLQPWLDSSNLNYYTSNIGVIRNSSNSDTGNTQQYPNSVMRSIVLYMAANQQFRWSVYSEGTSYFETHFDYAHQSGYLIG